jgi:hypothetical protein
MVCLELNSCMQCNIIIFFGESGRRLSAEVILDLILFIAISFTLSFAGHI